MKIKLDISLPTHQFNFPQILNLMSVQGPITLIQANNMCSQVPRLPTLFILLFKNITAITAAHTCSVLPTCHCASTSSHTWLSYRLLASRLGNVRFSAFPNSIIFAQSFVKNGHVLKYTSTGIQTHTHTHTHTHGELALSAFNKKLTGYWQGRDNHIPSVNGSYSSNIVLVTKWRLGWVGFTAFIPKIRNLCSILVKMFSCNNPGDREVTMRQMWRRNWVRGFLLQ